MLHRSRHREHSAGDATRCRHRQLSTILPLMTEQPDPEEQRLESVYESMLTALARRDIGLLDTLLADDIEFRSYATGSDPMRGKSDVLEAVKATRDRLFEPVLLGFEHLGAGWLIAAAQLRHSVDGGWMADSRKAALARVVDGKVHVSLASPTAAEAHAEFEARRSVGPDRP